MSRRLELHCGADAVSAFLKKTGHTRDDFADETQHVPIHLLHEALKAFRALGGPPILSLSTDLLARDCLGALSHFARQARGPEGALSLLERGDPEAESTLRWRTVASEDRSWRGSLEVRHDPALEADGLLREARTAELVAIVKLFGYPSAYARCVAGQGTEMETYEVTWGGIPLRKAVSLSFGCSVLLVVPLGLLEISLTARMLGLMIALGPPLATAVALRVRGARVTARAASLRLQMLERSLLLRETANDAESARSQGAIIAGQYRIRHLMGTGASGAIYEAVRTSDGAPVAIKLLRAGVAHDNVASDRLRREADALGLVWHPHVVEVRDQGVLPDGTSYLVMERLLGETLEARLERSVLSHAEAVLLGSQVAEALIAVHAAGVIHRDLKPANVFLSRTEDENVPFSIKLLDFGIAKVEWEEMRITLTGGPLGTPGYMSPEQEYGREVDARSDLFALGAILHECLLGEVPAGPKRSGTIRMEERGSRSSPPSDETRRASGTLPSQWAEIIQRAIAPNPDERYPSARSMLVDLGRLEASIEKVHPGGLVG